MQIQDSLIQPRILSLLTLFRSRTVRQTLMLYVSKLAVIPLGVITASMITRTLGPDNYGLLALYGTVTGFPLLFFRFGFDSSCGLLIAREDDENNIRELIGAGIIVFLLTGATSSLFVFGFSFFVDDIFHTNIGSILKWAAIPLVVAPFQFLIVAATRGGIKIGRLSLSNILPNILSLLGVSTLLAFSKLNVISLIALGLGISIACKLFIFGSLKPSFDGLKSNMKKLWLTNKEYGHHLYWGQIADQSTYKLDGILISYFVNPTQLGFYSLADTLVSPIVMLSQSLSLSLFRDFARMERIPKKAIYFNFLWLVSCVAGVILIGKYVVVLLFSERFLAVAPLAVALALAAFFQGGYQPYNMFLGAHGKGRWMRNMSFLAMILNVVGNIILIPIYGVMGAVIASIVSRLGSCLAYLFYYSKFTSENPG